MATDPPKWDVKSFAVGMLIFENFISPCENFFSRDSTRTRPTLAYLLTSAAATHHRYCCCMNAQTSGTTSQVSAYKDALDAAGTGQWGRLGDTSNMQGVACCREGLTSVTGWCQDIPKRSTKQILSASLPAVDVAFHKACSALFCCLVCLLELPVTGILIRGNFGACHSVQRRQHQHAPR